MARGPLGLVSISNETRSPPTRRSNSSGDWTPPRWKKYSFPSSAAIKPKPRSATTFLIVPVVMSDPFFFPIQTADARSVGKEGRPRGASPRVAVTRSRYSLWGDSTMTGDPATGLRATRPPACGLTETCPFIIEESALGGRTARLRRLDQKPPRPHRGSKPTAPSHDSVARSARQIGSLRGPQKLPDRRCAHRCEHRRLL